MEQTKDIFISYKNDGEGNNFAARLCADLEKMGYDVYYNPNEQHAGSFPDRLRKAVESCTDFLLVLTKPCLEQLMRHDKIDWVREELLTAHRSGKNIIPLLMPGVSMPKDKNDMPDDIDFLPDTDAVNISEPYDKSPLEILINWVFSKPVKEDKFKTVFNSNLKYDVKSDFEDILKRAYGGDLSAKYEAAIYYFDGIATDIDYENASRWLFEVSDSDNDELSSHANALIASMYYNGTVPKEEQSYEKAYYYRCKAEKSPSAQSQAAFMKKIGSGCEFVFDEIEKSYKSIENGDNISKLGLAQFYITYGEFSKAIDLLENIDDIFPEAEYQLGLLYKLGVHTKPPKPDYKIAAYHFLNAAEENHIQSAYEYGMLHFNPTGRFKKNFKIAEKYFEIAAKQGVAEAQYKLAWIYRFGLSGHQDIGKAIYYFEKAANQGHIGALSSLVHLYQYPGYTDYYKAFCNAKRAADMGDSMSAYRLANFYFIGRGCQPDLNKAYEYYNLASKHGIHQAEIMRNKIDKMSSEE